MKTMFEKLPDNVEKLKTLLLSERKVSLETIKVLQEKNQYLLELFRLAQQKQFGKSSEKHSGQGELFNEAEVLVDEETESQSQDEKTVSKPLNKPKRKQNGRASCRERVLRLV